MKAYLWLVLMKSCQAGTSEKSYLCCTPYLGPEGVVVTVIIPTKKMHETNVTTAHLPREGTSTLLKWSPSPPGSPGFSCRGCNEKGPWLWNQCSKWWRGTPEPRGPDLSHALQGVSCLPFPQDWCFFLMYSSYTCLQEAAPGLRALGEHPLGLCSTLLLGPCYLVCSLESSGVIPRLCPVIWKFFSFN